MDLSIPRVAARSGGRPIHATVDGWLLAVGCIASVLTAGCSSSRPALATTPSTTTGACALLSQSEIRTAVGGRPQAGKAADPLVDAARCNWDVPGSELETVPANSIYTPVSVEVLRDKYTSYGYDFAQWRALQRERENIAVHVGAGIIAYYRPGFGAVEIWTRGHSVTVMIVPDGNVKGGLIEPAVLELGKIAAGRV